MNLWDVMLVWLGWNILAPLGFIVALFFIFFLWVLVSELLKKEKRKSS